MIAREKFHFDSIFLFVYFAEYLIMNAQNIFSMIINNVKKF